MMEAIGQNSAIESTLDATQNLNNDETNFKLNVVENSPHDDEEDDDDDDDVIEVNEETNKIITTNSQIIEVEDEDKMSQTSSNGANKSNVECDENEPEKNVDKDLKRSLEDCNTMQQTEDETSYQKHLNENQLNNKFKEITTKSEDNKKDENPKVEEEEQNEKATYAEVVEVVDLEATEEPRTIKEVDFKDVENSEQNKRTLPHIIDVSQASEDESLRSDDEDVKEQTTKSLENKDNSDNALRIEIEDSLESCNNDSKDSADVPIKDAATESASTQHLPQAFPVKDDINCCNNETIGVEKTTRVDDEKDVVSISDEESEHSIQEEEEGEGADQKQQDSTMDVDVDVVEAVNETHRDEVINLDDETQDGLNSVTNMAQQEKSTTTECITINEESQDLVVEQKDQEQSKNDSNSDVMDINENSLHSDEEMQEMQPKDEESQCLVVEQKDQEQQQNDSNNDVMDINENSLHSNEEMQEMQPEYEEKLNGIDELSNEGLRIDLADEDDDGEDKQQYEYEQQNLQVSTPPAVSTNEEQTHATTTDMDYFAAAKSSDDGDNLITSIKRQFLKNEHSSSVPKLNGEHKNSETDATQTVIDIQADAQTVEPTQLDDDDDDDDDDNNDYSSALKIVEEHSKDSFPKENSQHSDEASKSPHGKRMLLNESDDEASRFSMASAQSSSTATSSSHQLVIDHQSEDIDPLPPPPSIQTYNPTNTSPLRPFKINLKRKLSQTSDTSASSPPQHKIPHLDFQLQQNDAANEEQTELTYPILNGETIERQEKPTELDLLSRSPSPVLKIVETATESEYSSREAVEEASQATDDAETIDTTVAAEKSYQTSPARSSPLLNSLLLKKLPLPSDRLENFTPPQIPNKTKYLCFNCKSGSFNSLVALNEHQHICLANKALLPEVTTSTLSTTAITPTQTPPVSPQQSLEKAISPAHNQQIPETPLEKRRYYQCSSCRTYHENWNLFLHIREIHKRHTCLYCIRMFPTAEKLSLHLEIKHDLEQNHFNSEEALRKSTEQVEDSVNEAHFLMCCTCQHVFLEHENFSDHVCTEYMQACSLCGQKGRHTNQCKAQNEAKRSKVKKKSKARDSTTPVGLTHESSTRQSNPPSVMPQPEYASNMPHKLTTNCDNVQPSPLDATFQPSTTALPTLSLPQPQQQQHHNEDSNSSCNMVIDETCNSTNYSRSAPYNPFKALDERERLEQQTVVAQAVLPPDRNQITEQAANKPEPVQPLIVPKFKLRVPKEFQKSVDAAISSTESEDDEELVIQENDADKQTTSNVSSTPSTTPHMDVDNESFTESAAELPTFQEAEEENKQPGDDAVEDDDSLDEPNSNLVRILQEIERTKLDIMRTKETLHTSSKTATATPRLATISQSSSRTGEHNWSPTPPASPNSQWYTPRRAISHGEEGEGSSEVETKNESLSVAMPPPALPIQQERRRNTTGSDVDMDIDETITGQPVQCIERPTHREEAPIEKDKASRMSTATADNKFGASTDSSFADIDVENTSMEMEQPNKPAPIDQENEHHVNTVMAEQKDTAVLEQAMPIENIEQPPSTSENQTTNKQEDNDIDVCSDKEDEEEEEVEEKEKPQQSPPPPADGITVADDETIAVDLQLDRPLEKFQTIEFVRICLKAVYPLCLYCNHARRIAVNGKSLVLHLIAQHRFAATVDSITAEELKPSTIVAKLKSYLPELEEHYFNSNSYCTFGEGAFTHHFNERIFECFQCRFVTTTHKELYLHNRKMHLKTAILCFMCRANFFSFSEILCHICPGESHKISVFDVKFRCCLCDVDNIPSPFRLMVHLRKKHFACDVCLEDCRDQGRLSSHVWKHKLHHLCYRCGIAYRNKMDITKHLFWKHGTESIICKRCLQKRWRHVYHFCVPPVNFACDICNLCFSKATYLKVHKRIHTGDLRYPCTDENCEQKFISRRLLLKHTAEHQLLQMLEPKTMLTEKEKEKSEQQAESAAHIKDEIKEEAMEDVNQRPLKDESKDESQQGEIKSDSGDKKSASTETAKLTEATPTGDSTSCKQRKKKKSKRNKESLEDLNLIAPNLSESDSSDDSDVESKSKSGDDSLVPNVMLSPTSDAENAKEEDEGATKKDSPSDASGKVLDIWKNFLQAQGAEAIGDSTEPTRDATDYTEDYYPTPSKLHVAQSDHDYCVMSKPESPKTLTQEVPQTQISPHKRKTAKSPRRTSARRSDGSSGSSSGGSSGSSSDSSCSCGSNCSCSSSNSGSSSSSSSSKNSGDSSAASHASRKRHRKKSERDRMRKKSESVSPMKKHSMSESGGKSLLAADVDVGTEVSQPAEPIPPNEPLFSESDLETAESETDEEFYDEHPQKLATELLAQKRAQLMAQTRLSPSHNFDIVENSRPSTPSLPDEVARERKVKLKKKKRERKSTSRSIATGVPPLKLNLGIASSPNVANGSAPNQHLPEHLPAAAQQMMPLNTATNIMGSSYELMRRSSFGIAETSSGTQQQFNATSHAAAGHQLTPRPIGPQHHMGRMSEGSSCSDADASLKRSKRARRPNKFYGYTSDEEHNMSGLGQPLMIGMRAIKPQPPPQLTWRKEDLPTPSKSIINNNKIKTPRTPKTPNTPHNLQTAGVSLFNANLSGPVPTLLKKNRAIRGSDNGKIRKRNSKKSSMTSKLPPIPTLKIRSSQIGLAPTHQHMQVPTVGGGGTNHIPASQIYSSSKESDDEDDDEEVDSTDSSSEEDGSQQITPSTSAATATWNNTQLQTPGATPTAPVAALILPQVAPAPPPPQAVAFNQKIPPALLPNPDFATLQYFKANNIRYPIRPPAGARQAREGESVYCYCRCPYDEVSEMIACDGENCLIEWFHFECVGIMVAPQGKWFCAECRPKYSEELYPTASTA